MRFFDRLDDPNGYRFAMPKSLQPDRQGLRGRTMTATGIG
jgi:hypothetical protein